MSVFLAILFFTFVAGALLIILGLERAFQKKYNRLYQELTLVLTEISSDKGSEGTAYGQKLCRDFFSTQPYAHAWERCLRLSLLEEEELPPLASPSQITREIFNRILNSGSSGPKSHDHQVS